LFMSPLNHESIIGELDEFKKTLGEEFQSAGIEIHKVREEYHSIFLALEEMISLSTSLDNSNDPDAAFNAANNVFTAYTSLYEGFRRAHENIKSKVLGDLKVNHEWLTSLWSKFTDLLSRLLKNAIAAIQRYAKQLGINSFSVTVSSSPPSISVTLTF
jgi:hypothetical protein